MACVTPSDKTQCLKREASRWTRESLHSLLKDESSHGSRVAVRMPPNASAHLLPEAGARNERTLEAVRCSAMLAVPS